MSQENDLEEVEIELTEEEYEVYKKLADEAGVDIQTYLQNLISEAFKSGKFKEIVKNTLRKINEISNIIRYAC